MRTRPKRREPFFVQQMESRLVLPHSLVRRAVAPPGFSEIVGGAVGVVVWRTHHSRGPAARRRADYRRAARRARRAGGADARPGADRRSVRGRSGRSLAAAFDPDRLGSGARRGAADGADRGLVSLAVDAAAL